MGLLSKLGAYGKGVRESFSPNIAAGASFGGTALGLPVGAAAGYMQGGQDGAMNGAMAGMAAGGAGGAMGAGIGALLGPLIKGVMREAPHLSADQAQQIAMKLLQERSPHIQRLINQADNVTDLTKLRGY